MKKHRFDDIPRYRSWVKKRDRALEDLHTRAQLESADIMRGVLSHVLLVAKAQFTGMKAGHTMSVDWFEHGLRHEFEKAAQALYKVIGDLRVRSYTLARASESEIIAQVQRRQITADVSAHKVNEIRNKDSVVGGHLKTRINLYLDRLRRKITSYAQAAALSAKDPEEFARDVYYSFPKARRVNVPRRILKPQLMEADYTLKPGTDAAADISIDNIDEFAWQDMLDAYMSDYVPQTRAPEFEIGMPEVTGQDTWYAWEFERDITNEFVQSVRDGQIDAATDNGITDFVWISVIDDRTDLCCAWRDGLLVSEIEAQSGDHEGEDDECSVEGDGLTPPIHFNCRCTLAPATDNIPDKPDDGAKDFDDWLNS